MPRSPKGRAAARGLDARSASNTLSCLLEMLHLKELRSIKMLIDSNHGIYRDPGPLTDSCTAANSISIRFYSITSSARAMSFTNDCILICINAVARKHKCDVLATRQHVELKRRVTMSKMRICFLAAVAAAGIGLGGTFGASAVPMNGNLVGATAPAPELQKVYYYHRHARRAYRRGYYGGYYRHY